MTALAAARFALEKDTTIRTRFPNARIEGVDTGNPSNPAMDGTAPEWMLFVREPGSTEMHQIAVKEGHVGEVASGSGPGNGNLPLVANLASGTDVADVMDSDRAIEVTEALGGKEYREQT